MMGLPDGPKSFKIGLVVLIQYRLWRTATQPRFRSKLPRLRAGKKTPCVGYRVAGIHPLCFLARRHKRQLNQALSVLSLSLTFALRYFVICMFCHLIVLVRSLVPVQLIDWKDSSPNWPIMCWWGRQTLLTHSLSPRKTLVKIFEAPMAKPS